MISYIKKSELFLELIPVGQMTGLQVKLFIKAKSSIKETNMTSLFTNWNPKLFPFSCEIDFGKEDPHMIMT